MLRQLSRVSIVVALCLLAAHLAGCVVDSGSKSSDELSYLRIQPDYRLKAAPEGYIYELWFSGFGVDIDTLVDTIQTGGGQDSIIFRDTAIVFIDTTMAITRFQWDPYLYAATDAQGNFLPLTSGDGMNLGVDFSEHFVGVQAVAFITLEPINDPLPLTPNFPMLVANQLNPLSHTGILLNPFAIAVLIGGGAPNASFELLSQSNKKGVPNSQWRDNSTEGFGIWFADPTVAQNVIVDTAGGYLAYSTLISPPTENPYTYTVWKRLDPAFPESSFSNFGQVLGNREPDLLFSDNRPVHQDSLKFGPGGDPRDGNPPPIHLDEDPVIENGVTIGYRYISPDLLDTCILRLDNVALTHCNRDTLSPAVLPFGTPDTTVRSFSYTTGDTTITSTLGGILDLSDPIALNRLLQGNAFIFAGYEYEAWLVFTQASGIPPLSLGRFNSPMHTDAANPYTLGGDDYDSNFTFPGEDFLQNLPAPLTAPLNVVTNPDVEKLWITAEPVLGLDWAPNEPNTQLIYLAAYIPKEIRPGRPVRFPMIFQNLDPTPTGLTNGNGFPTVRVSFGSGPAQ